MNPVWQVRKVCNLLPPNWVVHGPDGWAGSFNSHAEAMRGIDERVRTAWSALEAALS